MSADTYLATLRRWPPGRRVKIRGADGGTILYPVPRPEHGSLPNEEAVPAMRFSLAVEVEKTDRFDVVMVEESELELEPFDASLLRQDLRYRVVEFDRPHAVGLPSGARSYGLIEDVVFLGASPTDYAVGVKVEVDGNPHVNVHHFTADFTQCRLKLRTK